MGCDRLTVLGWVTGIAIGVAFGLSISCSANQQWIQSDTSGRDANGGLWEYCTVSNNVENCTKNWDLDDWLSQSK